MIDVVLDLNGRVRIDMIDDFGKKNEGVHILANSTGSESRTLMPSTDGKVLGAFIRTPRPPPWAVQPTMLLNLGMWDISGVFDSLGGRVEGEEIIGEHQVVRVCYDQTTREPPGDAFRATYWLAPSLGYAAVRRERQMKPNRADLPWKQIEETNSDGFVKHGDIWLPTRVSYVDYQYGSDVEYQLMQEVSCTFEDWKLNLPLTDESFAVEIPDGTRVRDFVTRGGRSYVKGKINESAIRKQVEKASEASPAVAPTAKPAASSPALLAQFDQATRADLVTQRDQTNAYLLAIVVVLALAVIVLFIALIRQGRRQRRAP